MSVFQMRFHEVGHVTISTHELGVFMYFPNNFTQFPKHTVRIVQDRWLVHAHT